MKTLSCAGILLAFGLSGAPALAQDQPQQPTPQQMQRRQMLRQRLEKRFERRFQMLDSNKDGVIGRDEWKRRPQAFDRIDRNGDGVLSKDELRAALRAKMRRAQ